MKNKKKRSKEDEADRRMGKRTGYRVVDGKYYIAPVYVERMRQLRTARLAISEMLASVASHARQEFERIYKDERRWWQDVSEDIGVPLTTNTMYTHELNGEDIGFIFEKEQLTGDVTKPAPAKGN